ncbi:ankyrin repeat domain-containing protein [Noviherbaspirillum malthae]|jgi:ankyrin repeat protein|uniref:ankyrin repeat domain-containing protein n=1 Tax=Noviherbaspirillum malthae TaxID=1260987 RepID=UPI001890537D|nr:ankyrin repeat domain-containing protein [Noviherbaspirillum malthae]
MNTVGISNLRRSMVAAMGAVALGLAAASSQARAGAYDDFFRAVKIDDAKAVASLLARGLDPNLIEPERGETGLIMALRADSMKVFETLLKSKQIDLEVKAFNGDNALMMAAYKGNLPAVEALIEQGAEINKTGWTPLHYAAFVGNNDIVKLLLDKSAYIDAESPNKTTPIMMAARAGHILTVKLLLDEGADATLKNDAGMTAIDFANKYEFKDIAEGLTFRLRKAGKLQ